MGKKIILIFTLFLILFINLHQKIQMYVEAYRLGENYRTYRRLVDIRDHLLYNFCRKAPLDRLNLWAENNGFVFAEKTVRVALNTEQPSRGRFSRRLRKHSLLVQKLMDISGISRALAQQEP